MLKVLGFMFLMLIALSFLGLIGLDLVCGILGGLFGLVVGVVGGIIGLVAGILGAILAVFVPLIILLAPLIIVGLVVFGAVKLFSAL